MKTRALLILAVVFLGSGCAPKSDLDAANKKVTELQAQVQALQAENSKLQTKLSKKPELPVTLSLRKAMMGPGYVAIFNTTVKEPVSVLAILKSAALGTTKQFELHLNPMAPTELGHLEGATIEAGDTITLENSHYSSISFTAIP